MRPSRARSASFAQLFVFGAQNALLGWKRSLLLWLTFGAIGVGGFSVGAAALRDHARDEERRRFEGAMIVVASSVTGLDARHCERLGTLPGVVGAGAVGQMRPDEVRPGINAPRASITPGFAATLLDHEGANDPDRWPAILVGTGLAARLSIEEGTSLGGQYAVPDRGQRTEFHSAAVLDVVPVLGRAAQCWLETSPASYEFGDELLIGALRIESSDLEVRSLLFDGGPHQFDRVRLDQAAAAAGAMLALVSAVFIGLRRIELAMYRLVGLSRLRTAFTAFVEISVAMVSAVAVTTGLCLVHTSRSGPLPRSVIAAAGYVAGAAVVTALCIVALYLIALARTDRQLAVLREGS